MLVCSLQIISHLDSQSKFQMYRRHGSSILGTTARCPAVESFIKQFLMALCMILRDSSSLVSLFLFVTSAWNVTLRTLSSSCNAVCFKIYFSRWLEAPASEDVRSFTVLWSRSKDYVCLFTGTELSSCIASFETTGNLDTCTFLRWL